MVQKCVTCGSDVTDLILPDPKDYEYGSDWDAKLMACQNCRLVQQVPMPSESEALDFYPTDYVHYNPSPKGGLREKLLRLYSRRVLTELREMGAGPGKRLLDVGCGCGEKSSILRDVLGLEIVGVEPSIGASDAARRNFGLDVHTGTLSDVELEAESFDFVMINHVIEHHPDPVALLNSIHRALKPGGQVFGETENIDCISFRLFGRYWSFLHFPYHLLYFTKSTLKSTFGSSAFDEASIGHHTDPLAWSLSIQNYLRRNTPPAKLDGSRIPGYLFLSLSCVPLALIEYSQGPVLKFSALREK